jgi:nucleoside-diphosphate-sugar epimerase
LQNWYCAAKTIAEETAVEYGEKNGLIVVTVCPCIVLGPLLQPLINASSELLVYIIKGGFYIFLLVSNIHWLDNYSHGNFTYCLRLYPK